MKNRISPHEGSRHEQGNNQVFIVLPGMGISISETANQAFRLIADSIPPRVFYRGGVVVECIENIDGRLEIRPLKAHAFRSHIEKHGGIVELKKCNGELVPAKTTCNAETARALLESAEAREILFPLKSIAPSPIIVRDGTNGCKVLGKGYHNCCGGTLVANGDVPPEVNLSEATSSLLNLLRDFQFQSPSDKSRFVAALLTPAFRAGGWLEERIPLFDFEADQSQTGKELSCRLVAGIYGETPFNVAEPKKGIGSVEEAIGNALLMGLPFVHLDNWKGRLDNPYIESMLTAASINVRVSFRENTVLDPRKTNLYLSSNGVFLSKDMANRSCIIRLLKQSEGYVFYDWKEGELLDHVKANQSYYLACVFAVIRHWAQMGCQKNKGVKHDFRKWAGIMDWIGQNIFHTPPLMDDHREIQHKATNEYHAWLEKLGSVIKAENLMGAELSASQIALLSMDHEIFVPHCIRAQDNQAINQIVGRNLSQMFDTLKQDWTKVGGYLILRKVIKDVRSDGKGNRESWRYVFNEESLH